MPASRRKIIAAALVKLAKAVLAAKCLSPARTAKTYKATLELGIAHVIPGSGTSYSTSDFWYDAIFIKTSKGLGKDEAIADMKYIAPQMQFKGARATSNGVEYTFIGRVRLKADNLVKKVAERGYRLK